MLLSLRRRHGTASRKHNPYQYRIFSQGNSVCAYIAFETHIRCKTDNFALFAPPNKKSNLHYPPTKRELAGYDAGIHATDNESLKADLQAAFDRKSVLLKKQEAALNDFTKQTGLARDRAREQSYGFSKSVSQKAVITSKGNLRNTTNTGAFSILPERMTKKHVREIAKETGIDLHSIKIRIDNNEELLRIPFAGRADYEEIGSITLFPNAFRSKEELTRTVFHEIIHANQFRKYGSKYVQDNRAFFEKITSEQEEQFIKSLKERGLL